MTIPILLTLAAAILWFLVLCNAWIPLRATYWLLAGLAAFQLVLVFFGGVGVVVAALGFDGAFVGMWWKLALIKATIAEVRRDFTATGDGMTWPTQMLEDDRRRFRSPRRRRPRER